MKKIINVCFFCFVFLNLSAQTNRNYQILITKAGLLHLQKNYKEAVDYYDQAFKIQNPDALTAYKVAGVYSLADNSEKAFFYLQTALNKGWTEANWLISDPYFENVKKANPEKWKMMEREAYQKEQQYSQSLSLASLRKEINLMTLKDQQLRFKRAQANNDSLLKIIDQEINLSDLDNLNRAKQIIRQYGWPTISQIGKDGQNNLWLIVQHADQDIEFQKKALAEMEKLKGSQELNMENYAFLYDRVQCNLNYKQLYGTQVVWSGNGEASEFRPIKDEYLVDERRKKLGLEPLEIYSLTYGFNYKKLTKQESERKDKIYHGKVQDLIEKAKISFKNKEFQKTYDYYNEASTFSGGMSDDDNFDAAVIFSKIALQNDDEKYRSIALDFLDLLNMRSVLTKTKLLNQPSLQILKNEERWKKLMK